MKFLRSMGPALIRREVLNLARRQPLPARCVALASVLPPSRHFSTHHALLGGQKKGYGPDDWPSKDSPHNYDHKIKILLGGLKVTLPKEFQVFGKTPIRDIFPYTWLRDNCRCRRCVNPDTMQRTVKTFRIPENIQATGIRTDHARVQVTWNTGHRSIYTWEFLAFYMFNDNRVKIKGGRQHKVPSQYQNPVEYHDHVMNFDSHVGALTQKIRRYGYCFVEDVPHEDPLETKKLLERIAFIRETHYGGFYDFKPDLAMADTAYTNIALDPHTDTTYFSDPAGLQAFHMLSHEPDADGQRGGGDSILVDGFYAARTLQEEDPDAYEVLSEYKLPWHASGNPGITIAPDLLYPVLESDESGLRRVRWNNDDRGVVPFQPPYRVDDWYRAAKLWNEIIHRGEMQRRFQLTPGVVLIFDNWRMLHGRTAFKGIRRMCGAYINRDDFISRWRNTNMEREVILDHIVG